MYCIITAGMNAPLIEGLELVIIVPQNFGMPLQIPKKKINVLDQLVKALSKDNVHQWKHKNIQPGGLRNLNESHTRSMQVVRFRGHVCVVPHL